ncbi:MAG: hypothetical protein Q7V88_15470, partial [Actinomycetota bacterium]|nr:hypothetical protein [Actinomycetota bacterium]
MSAIDDKVQQLANDGFDVGTPLTTQGTDDTGRSWQQFTNAWLLAEPGDTGVWIIWGTTLTTYNDTGGI